ncbi:hypothetical protein K492DRAFT_171241 [Lichtheimia hyalospora FSU 10163]|nr:hypothetical protein K492DRAFT_171241 [Lichtheimia hyalospora FSU 10163]
MGCPCKPETCPCTASNTCKCGNECSCQHCKAMHSEGCPCKTTAQGCQCGDSCTKCQKA